MHKKALLAIGAALALTAVGVAQLDKLLKVGGVVAAVKLAGPQMNSAINKLTKHTDSYKSTTKVVVILSVGLTSSTAIGAAQVTGPKDRIDQVVAVAEPTADLLGHQVTVRGLIPVASKDFTSGFKTVDGVGVTGLVDIRL